LAILQKVFTDTGQTEMLRGINLGWLRRKQLYKTIFWVKRQSASSFGRMETITHVAEKFRDGFPGKTLEEVITLIRNSNRRNFNSSGDIKSNWQELTIPENTIDLFEAYT